jgi:hypothetical protein
MKKNKKILIFGSGRWARIYISYLKKYSQSIYVYTYKKSLLEKNFDTKKVKNLFITNNLKVLKDLIFDRIIIANKTVSHVKSLKKIAKLGKRNIPCLIEKPFSQNINYLNTTKYFIKQNYLSLQYSFSDYFFYLKKKIKGQNILCISMFWYDKASEKKNYNKKMFFIEDVYYHFFSILRFFIPNDLLDLQKADNLSINKSNLKFKTNKILVQLFVKKSCNLKKRILVIKTKNGMYKIDFVKLNIVKMYFQNRLVKKFKKNLLLIKRQLFYFLFLNLKIKKNSLIYLDVLLKNLMFLRKTLT